MKLPPAALSVSIALHTCIAAVALRWAFTPGRGGAQGEATEMAIGFELVGDTAESSQGAEVTPPAPEVALPTPPEETVAAEVMENSTMNEPEEEPPVPVISTGAPTTVSVPRAASRTAGAATEVKPTRRRSGSQKGSGGGAGLAGGRGNGSFAPPSYRNCPAPPFPPEAKREGRSGVVLLTVAVDKSGVPTSVAIHRSSGSRLLDDAAVAAVRRWRFEPARAGSEPVAARVEIPGEISDLESRRRAFASGRRGH